jgi:hypothetical protein
LQFIQESFATKRREENPFFKVRENDHLEKELQEERTKNKIPSFDYGTQLEAK